MPRPDSCSRLCAGVPSREIARNIRGAEGFAMTSDELGKGEGHKIVSDIGAEIAKYRDEQFARDAFRASAGYGG